MKKLFANLVYFVFIFIFIIGSVLFIEKKWVYNEAYFNLPKDKKYMIFGHSHSECAFNDTLINHFANFGRSGEAYVYTYIKAKKIIESNLYIDTIFIEYTNNHLLTSTDSWIWSDKYMHAFLPVMLPLLEYEEAKLLFSKNPAIFLGVTTSCIKNIFYLYKKKPIQENKVWGGYEYLVMDHVDSLIRLKPTDINKIEVKTGIAETNLKYLKKIIDMCKQNNKKVFLIRSPLHAQYKELENEPEFKKLLETTFAAVEFLDFKDFPLKNSEFGDLEHLNFRGAQKISLFFNTLLSEGLLKKENKQAFINAEMQKIN
jgi:hypothetical protein